MEAMKCVLQLKKKEMEELLVVKGPRGEVVDAMHGGFDLLLAAGGRRRSWTGCSRRRRSSGRCWT